LKIAFKKSSNENSRYSLARTVMTHR